MSLQTVAMLAVLWLFNVITVAPLLAAGAVRRLFRRPTTVLPANYLLWTAAVAVSQFLAVTVPVVVLRDGRLGGIAFFSWLGGLSIGNAALWAVVGAVAAHRQGWSPKHDDELLDGRLALALGLGWYALAVAVGLFVVLVVGIALFFPG